MILVLGDSFTAGSGLADYDPKNPYSKYSWPSLIEQQTGISVENRAQPGASNAQILNQFLTYYDQDKHTAIIVLWSFLSRIYFPDPANPDTLITGRTTTPTNSTSQLNRILEFYYKYFYSDKVSTWELNGFQLILQNKARCPVLHDCVDTQANVYSLDANINWIDTTCPTSFNNAWVKQGKKIGSQGNHYSEETHKYWVENYVIPALKRCIDLDSIQQTKP